MRLRRKNEGMLEGDLTPMIDMTFQLIAFFMVLINFSQTETNERIQLPKSELAKPPETPLDYPITLQLTDAGTVLIGGDEVYPEGLRPYLVKEADVLKLQGKPQSEATVIIRADKDARTGDVQEVIEICQKNNYEKFALRAKEEVE